MKHKVEELKLDLEMAKRKLSMFLEAEDAVVRGGQSMMIDDGDMKRMVSRVDAKWIAKRIIFWRSEVSRLQSEIYNQGKPSRKGIYLRLM